MNSNNKGLFISMEIRTAVEHQNQHGINWRHLFSQPIFNRLFVACSLQFLNQWLDSSDVVGQGFSLSCIIRLICFRVWGLSNIQMIY